MLTNMQKNLCNGINTQIDDLRKTLTSSNRITPEMENQLKLIMTQQGEFLRTIRENPADVGVMLLFQAQMGSIQALNKFYNDLPAKALRDLINQVHV